MAGAPPDFGTGPRPGHHRTLRPIDETRGMILLAFTLSLRAAVALIIGLGTLVSLEAQTAPGGRADAGLV